MSAINSDNNNAEWTRIQPKKSWSIDRKQQHKKPTGQGRNQTDSGSYYVHQGPNGVVNASEEGQTGERQIKQRTGPRNGPHNGPRNGPRKIVKEKIPDVVAQMLVTEVLSLVGNHDWNDPANVSKTFADMMSIDLTKDIHGQTPRPVEIDRTVYVPSNKGSDIPFWIAQSVFRVDENLGKRFIEFQGSKYNKIDIIFGNVYFKKQMDMVAKAAHCTWNARWGNAQKDTNRLYQKTRPGSKSNESWLDRCVKHLLTDADIDGINIKNIVLIEFKRDLSLNDTTDDIVIVTAADTEQSEPYFETDNEDGESEGEGEGEGEVEGEGEGEGEVEDEGEVEGEGEVEN
jgi:hypothetical protein